MIIEKIISLTNPIIFRKPVPWYDLSKHCRISLRASQIEVHTQHLVIIDKKISSTNPILLRFLESLFTGIANAV